MKIQNLSLDLGEKTLLRDLTFSIEEPGICTILGANGAGKTLLLRCLAGLLPPTRGSLLFADGTEISRLSVEKIAARLSWTPLSAPLPFSFKVSELMLMGRYRQHQGYPSQKDREIALKALARMHMLDFADRVYNSLSRGEQTKVDIARAIASETPLLIFDEPFANLDIDACLQVQTLFRELKDEGRTLILSHHDLHSVLQLATHVVMIRKGEIVASGPVSETFRADAIRQTYQVGVEFLGRGPDALLQFRPLT